MARGGADTWARNEGRTLAAQVKRARAWSELGGVGTARLPEDVPNPLLDPCRLQENAEG